MKLNKFYAIISFLFICSNSYSQSEIKFIDEVYDFGFILEGERVSTIFEFENNGDDTLLLESVKPSCGCTSPNWPKRPILEGESEEINVTYNSSRRPGAFHKSIRVKSNATEHEKTIYIQGVVINSNDLPSDSIQSLYKGKAPGLAMNKKELFIGKTEKNRATFNDLYIENTSDREIKIKKLEGGCKCIHTKETPTIKPGESVKLQLNYTPRSLGKLEEKIIILTDDPAKPVYEVVIHTEVVKSLTIPKGLMLEEQRNTGFGF